MCRWLNFGMMREYVLNWWEMLSLRWNDWLVIVACLSDYESWNWDCWDCEFDECCWRRWNLMLVWAWSSFWDGSCSFVCAFEWLLWIELISLFLFFCIELDVLTCVCSHKSKTSKWKKKKKHAQKKDFGDNPKKLETLKIIQN